MIYYKQNMKYYEDEYNRCLNIHQSTLTTKEEKITLKHITTILKLFLKITILYSIKLKLCIVINTKMKRLSLL